jgi:hypothetical protein
MKAAASMILIDFGKVITEETKATGDSDSENDSQPSARMTLRDVSKLVR